jgi:hypothetical protein
MTKRMKDCDIIAEIQQAFRCLWAGERGGWRRTGGRKDRQEGEEESETKTATTTET